VPLAFDADPNRPCAVPAFVMWSIAVPLLALGFFVDSVVLLNVAGAAGCAATIAAAVQGAFVVCPISRHRPWLSWRRDHSRRRSASQQLTLPQTRL
jgi:membrane protein implicated in regulation of membrane protease activity